MCCIRSSTWLPRLLVPLTLAAWLSACMKWSATTDPMDQVLRDRQPKRVRVMMTDGRRFDLSNPTLDADSLVGYTDPSAAGTASGRLAVARADVERLEVRKTDTALSILAVAGTATVVLVIIAAFWAEQFEESLSQSRQSP